MIVKFEDTEYGTIECNSEARTAHFHFQDYEVSIDDRGKFQDMWGSQFEVTFPAPYMKSQDSILTILRPVQIGRVNIKRE